MAEAYNRPPAKHQLRRTLLSAVAHIPFLPMPDNTRRVLLIRPDHLGDVLLTIPAIRALKHARPDLELHALVGPWSAAALAGISELDQVLTFNFPGFSRSSKSGVSSPYIAALKTSRMLRKIGYDSAIILRPDHWWGALLAHLSGIRRRIGYDLPDVRPFLTEALPFEKTHSVLSSMALVERWTKPIPVNSIGLSFTVNADDDFAVDALLARNQLNPDARYFCIHPGSGTATKRWDDLRWATVADVLSQQLDARVIFTGSDHELILVQRIVENMTQPAIVAAGETSVSSLAGLFARALVVLGPDSGPLHLASAVQTPTVALFGPGSIAEFGTWGSPEQHAILHADIGCLGCGILDWGADAPENHPCMRDIDLGQVLDAARRVVRRDDN
jgi:heptosyltransferase-2/heptosyltransferase-3